jgi:hypothetical protein
VTSGRRLRRCPPQVVAVGAYCDQQAPHGDGRRERRCQRRAQASTTTSLLLVLERALGFFVAAHPVLTHVKVHADLSLVEEAARRLK